MICRQPDAVLTAHRMDPSRRELYVEGTRDRLFLTWLLGKRQPTDAIVQEIAFIEIPNVLGGERGRLIQFANWLEDKDVGIRMFADADCDRVLGRTVPKRVWLTDNRDLEGYVLRIECIDKVLRLGIATDKITAELLLRAIKKHCRRLGILRLLSERDSLKLPFQTTNLKRFIKLSNGELNLDFDGYFRALLQNASISLKQFKSLHERFVELECCYENTPDIELIHGKAAICIIDAALAKFGIRDEEGGRLLWCSFEARFVEVGSSLESVLAFIRTA